MIRLGFAVRTVQQPGLAGGSPPHLSITLTHLSDVIGYLERHAIRFYRFALPRAITMADLVECQNQLELLQRRIAALNLRLGLHLDPALTLSHPDETIAAEAIAAIEVAAHLLAMLDQPGSTNHTLVIHAGASDSAALARFAQRWPALSATARRRITIEHTTNGPALRALLGLATHTGAPIVFDYLHFQLHNPDRWSLPLALGLCFATWPQEVRPEVHLSSQRSEAHLLPGRNGATRVLPPRVGQHADFIVARDAIELLAASHGLPPFDLMLEAKAGDLALLRLRHDLARYAPNWADQVK
ncbi:UV damage endonuclease UvsE [Chloroflexus sp.]|uniref:UV damage endonuclease UvsE n=1 Tax=Chloroflexus sp. TaxID=1904827 RepID=UPI00298F264A|nr:UV damage endonuclease UvsE [Chloroflexus sp.]MDW8404375.1 UV damage endonuclease UvsE [Chloroflexus sp.]